MNLLNEEIRVIQCTISHLRTAIPLESDQGKRLRMKESVDELEKMIEAKLGETGEFEDIRISEDIY